MSSLKIHFHDYNKAVQHLFSPSKIEQATLLLRLNLKLLLLMKRMVRAGSGDPKTPLQA